MNKAVKIVIVIVLIVAIGIVIAVKQKDSNINTETSTLTNPDMASPPRKTASDSNNQLVMTVEAVEVKKLPTLVDLGADKCIPCKMMMPILDELTKEYAGKLHVRFYDVWKNPAYGRHYGIELIPTQIFLDPNGRELFRHQGFFSKEDILAKWKKLGFEIGKKD